MRLLARALVAVAVVGALASGSSASPPPQYVYRYVAFVTLTGHGTVVSTPKGIACPRSCRWAYPRGTHLTLRGAAAPGWRFVGFSSKWCNGQTSRCVFYLVSPHDCVGGACPLGAFGVRALFVRD
jgi:hypothetical protein